VTPRRAQRPTAEEPFRLPANISMHKEILPDGTAYVLRHREMGVLGRIRIQERVLGGSHLVCETAGDPADPMTAKRAAIFEPLGLALSALFPTDTEALARGVRPPPAPYDPGEWVRSERIMCVECGETAAVVSYALDAQDAGRLEDYARRLYSNHANWDLPGVDCGSRPRFAGTGRWHRRRSAGVARSRVGRCHDGRSVRRHARRPGRRALPPALNTTVRAGRRVRFVVPVQDVALRSRLYQVVNAGFLVTVRPFEHHPSAHRQR
jgi:hypothetical protein